MPKARKSNGAKHLTRAEAEKLYPNEWVIFVEPNVDRETTTFIDGVVFWHGPDQKECYRRLGKVKAACASFYMGVIPYRKFIFAEENEDSKKVA